MNPKKQIAMIVGGVLALIAAVVGIYYLVRHHGEGAHVTAMAKLPHVTASYSKVGYGYRAKVTFASDLSMVSAVHIHRGMNGTIGPIVSWFGTTPEWQNEPHHIMKNSNTPCCKDTMCNLIAPPGTADISTLAGKTIEVSVPYPHIGCDADTHLTDKNAYLVVHGKNFKAENKWLDIIGHTKFT